MRRGTLRVTTVLALALAGPIEVAGQQPAPPPVFAMLEGAWEGTGTLLGRPAAFEMTWTTGAAFAQLAFRNAFVSAEGAVSTVLRSSAIYRLPPGRAEGVWLDTRGVRIEITWSATDSTLVSDWTAPQESGRTTYRVRSDGAVEVIDEVMGSDGWREFARARFRKVR